MMSDRKTYGSDKKGSNAQSPSSRAAAVWWLVTLGIVAALAIVVSTSIAGKQNADGILATLISTQKMTWYFWGQDRLLNFLPALASPIHSVAWNLRFQLFLRAFLAFMAPAGFLYFFKPSARFLMLAVALTNCLLALTLSPLAIFNLYAEHNPFGTSLVLFTLSFLALRAAERNHAWHLAALIVGCIAYATNLALVVIALPMIVLMFCTELLPRRQLFRFLIVNIVSVALAYAHSRLVGTGETPFGQAHFSLAAIRAGYATVAANVEWLPATILMLACALYGVATRTRGVATALLLVLGSLSLIGVISCSSWAQLNGYHIRYYLTYVIAIEAMACFFITTFLYRFIHTLPLTVLATIAVFVLEWQVGLHGFSPAYDQLVDKTWRKNAFAVAKAATESDAQLLVGDYFYVWPAVFDSNIEKKGSDDDSDSIYGAAYRGDVLRNHIWRIAHQKNGIRSLCLLDSVENCRHSASKSLDAILAVTPGSVTQMSVDGSPVLLMTLTFSSAYDQNRSLAPLSAAEAKSTLVQKGDVTFDPETRHVHVSVEFRNLGTSLFSSEGAHAINLGAKLYTQTGALESIDFVRANIPDIAGGSTATVRIELPGDQMTEHKALIIPVQEDVAWFDQFGVKGLWVGPFHACNNVGRSWICNASMQPLPQEQ